MFKRIFYDSYHNKIYHWYVGEDGKNHKEIVTPKFEYYVPDKTGKSEIKDIYGTPVIMKTSKSKKDMKEVATCTNTSETDIPEDVKFLHRRWRGQNLTPDLSKLNICTIDIEVEADGEFPKASEAKYPINLISVHFSKSDKVYTFGNRPYNGNSDLVKNYHYCKDEKTMMERFITFFRKQKVDIITGWYIRFFDIPYIINRCKNLNIEMSLSPVNMYLEKSTTAGYHIDGGGYTIAGISTLDAQDLYKNFVYTKRESYSLQAIGMLEVGEGKKDYEGTINNAWNEDWDGFVEYNIQDVLLVKKIEEKKKHIELTVNFCYQALIPFEKIYSSISLITGYILKYLHERNLVYPDKKKQEKYERSPGAYVMANAGFYKHVVSFDVESMYPHMIMMYNISPETIVSDPKNPEDYIKCPISKYKTWDTADGDFKIGGIYYRKDKRGVLAEIVKDIFDDRKKLKKKMFIAKKIEKNSSYTNEKNEKIINEIKEEGGTAEYYDSQQKIRKILINSIFGVLGNEYFNFFDTRNFIAVTLGAQDLIKYLSNSVNSYMKQNWHKVAPKIFPDHKKEFSQLKKDVVILIDTDSNYLCFDEIIQDMGIEFNNYKDFIKWTDHLIKKLLNPFFKKILDIYAKKYGVEQIINFKQEKTITQKFILAKKKYVDEVVANEGEIYDKPKLSITGIEIVRTDTPSFSRKHIRGVVDEIFLSNGKDKQRVTDKIRKIYKEYLEEEPTNIAVPTGVKDYSKYAPIGSELLKKGIVYPKGCPIHVRSAINYNYLIAKYKMPLQPITNGTKMKYVYVMDHKNDLHQNAVGFVVNWPKKFDELFEVDYYTQWKKSFESVIQRFFDVLKWGEITLEDNSLRNFLEF